MASIDEAALQRLLRYPWTVLRETTPEGEFLLRVKEIPSAVGSGLTDAEREADLWESLEASLRAYLHFGDAVPMPEGVALAWATVSSQEAPRPAGGVTSADRTQTAGSGVVTG